jgi:hypothetical protein
MAGSSTHRPRFPFCCSHCGVPFDVNMPARDFTVGGVGGHILTVCPLCHALGYAGDLLRQQGFTILPDDRARLLAQLEEVVRYLQHLTNLSEQARLAQSRRTAAVQPDIPGASDVPGAPDIPEPPGRHPTLEC